MTATVHSRRVAPLLSVVIPVYNAAPLLDALHARLGLTLAELFRGQPGRYELIFVDDASRDDSLACLHRIAARDSAVRVVATGRNAGQQEATLLGLSLASGRYCATMDDDGQHPPALLPGMLRKLRHEGLDIVYAVPTGRKASLVRTVGSALRDALFAALFPCCGKTRVSSYRVMTRRLARRVLAIRAPFPYFSAMVFQEPTRAGTVTYPFLACPTGRSGYGLASLCSLYWKIFLHYGPFAPKRREAARHLAVREMRGGD